MTPESPEIVEAASAELIRKSFPSLERRATVKGFSHTERVAVDDVPFPANAV